ncbi:hypothetical protein ACOVUO_004910, partial [Escherichia coli]
MSRNSLISLLKSIKAAIAYCHKNKIPLAANKRGFYFYSLSFCQFAGFRVIRPCEQTAFFSKIFCLSVN